MTGLILNLTNRVLWEILNIWNILYTKKKKINPEKPGVHFSLCFDAGTFKAAGYHGNKDVEKYFAFLL